MSDQDARRLSPAAQEVVRLRVVAALESERVRSYGEAAEVFGVSRRSVGTWWRGPISAGCAATLPRRGVAGRRRAAHRWCGSAANACA
ncbi:helix-turn-helix domain-containing protein [Nocardia gipuzkoensis]|uniref:helix-turn-helix domain-containing protein n=1 Tax=Nocardia gipuzkoensis TaxID=2749991 RepID=UPI0038CD5239